MNMKYVLAGAAITAASATAVAMPLASSTFDSDTEGWNGVNGVVNFQWIANGGQSGGYVRGLDTGGGIVWLFDAPAEFLGDQSAAYGGTLSFYLKQFTEDVPFVTNLPDVKIIGSSFSLVLDAGVDPGSDWTFHSVALTPGAWHIDTLDGALATAADIQNVLSNIVNLRIRAEYSQTIDLDGLDTVVLSAIPEPETYALMLAGLGAIGLAARRRRGTTR